MSLSAVAVIAAGALTSTLGTPVVHAERVDHRTGSYDLEYRAHVAASTRTVGAASGARMSTQRCLVSADVSVERVIAGSNAAHRLATVLPGSRSFTQSLPGHCAGRDGYAAQLVARNESKVREHLAQVAASDRPQALAAIESAHHLAAN